MDFWVRMGRLVVGEGGGGNGIYGSIRGFFKSVFEVFFHCGRLIL